MDAISDQDRRLAKEMGVSLECPQDYKAMDDLHRHHIEDLRAKIARISARGDADAVRHLNQRYRLGRFIGKLRGLVHVWQLIAFAGWFVTGLFILRDLIGSGR